MQLHTRQELEPNGAAYEAYLFSGGGHSAREPTPPRGSTSVSKKIVAAGVPLRIRASLLNDLRDLKVLVARNLEDLWKMLDDEQVEALVVDESFIQGAPKDFFIAVDQAFLGVVIFCARTQLEPDQLIDLVARGKHSVLLYHPIDVDELLRRLVTQLNLQLTPRVLPERHTDLTEIWTENRSLLEERLQLLDRVSSQDGSPLEGGAGGGQPGSLVGEALLEEAWRAAFQLAGTLGSFGLEKGTLLAREAQALLLARPLDSFDAARLQRVVKALKAIVWSSAGPDEKKLPEGNVLIVTDDRDFAESLEVEALMLRWTVARAEDPASLLRELGQPLTRALILDLESQPAHAMSSLLADLIADGTPCLLLYPEPYPGWEESPHLRWLSKPVSPYEALLTVLRCQTAPPPENPPTVLVVDDDPIVLMVAMASLSQVDLHVVGLEDPLEFWETVRREKPDLILLDIDLPPLGGLELCRVMRADPQLAAVPVMFMSSYHDADTLQRAFEMGADDYLQKPVSSRELAARVNNRLQRTAQIAAHPFPVVASSNHASLNAMLLGALRQQGVVTLAIVRAEKTRVRHVQQLLRRTLRSSDLVKALHNGDMLVAVNGRSKEAVLSHLTAILGWEEEPAEVGAAEFPSDGSELEELLRLARPAEKPAPVEPEPEPEEQASSTEGFSTIARNEPGSPLEGDGGECHPGDQELSQ